VKEARSFSTTLPPVAAPAAGSQVRIAQNGCRLRQDLFLDGDDSKFFSTPRAIAFSKSSLASGAPSQNDWTSTSEPSAVDTILMSLSMPDPLHNPGRQISPLRTPTETAAMNRKRGKSAIICS